MARHSSASSAFLLTKPLAPARSTFMPYWFSGIGAQHQRGDGVVMRLDLAQHVEPRHVRQREVEQQHVAGRAAQQRQRLAARLRLARPGEIGLGLDDLLQPDTHELMIVYDCDTGGGHVISRLRLRRSAASADSERRPAPDGVGSSTRSAPRACRSFAASTADFARRLRAVVRFIHDRILPAARPCRCRPRDGCRASSGSRPGSPRPCASRGRSRPASPS